MCKGETGCARGLAPAGTTLVDCRAMAGAMGAAPRPVAVGIGAGVVAILTVAGIWWVV